MKTLTIELEPNLQIKIDFLAEGIINFHILKNDILRGKMALKYFKKIFDEIFQCGVKLILISLANKSQTRHIRLMALMAGFKKHMNLDNNIIYYLKKE